MSVIQTLTAPVPPGGTIGILGGGQLGRMLAMAAARLGLDAHVYSYEANAPASHVSAQTSYVIHEDRHGLAEFAKSCDVITFEFENISPLTVEFLSELKPVMPGLQALKVSQDRLEEKHFLRNLGIPLAFFWACDPEGEEEDAFLGGGRTMIFKTRRMGYDGKGQARVSSIEELRRAFAACGSKPGVLEDVVDFAFEASVIAARGQDGSFAAYDPPENYHAGHILRRSTVPGRLTQAQGEEAKAIARKIMEALGYVGVMCVELFVLKDGTLLVNEIAPRVHNSGHWTIDACLVSQFEQHIRAVAGWPLGSPARHSDAVMENLIGEDARDWQALAAKGGALHLYGKSEIRPGRKMGHITWLKDG